MSEELTTQNEKHIYRGAVAIGERLGIGKKLVLELINREANPLKPKEKPLPAQRVGREYWTTEANIIGWLNN